MFKITKTDDMDQRKHYEFSDYDESQGGVNSITDEAVTSVIQEQQNYNLANPALEQAANGDTYCNYVTQNVMDAYGSATGRSVTITGRGNEMADKLCGDQRYENVSQEKAEAVASKGGLAVVGFKNTEKKDDGTLKSGHVATLSVGTNLCKGKIVNVGTAAYQGIHAEPSNVFKKKDFSSVQFYILKNPNGQSPCN